ncbi:BTAD domain-containing putative transcriptional regulator [Micromonospora sp. NPDC048835]|uniref:AfsR/SARP family transcriptional regulator n=1 Tax=Micromonospora sp. NPDC048835 TaxID=3155147 RepID=UPI0033D11044
MTPRLRLQVMGPLRVWRDDVELDSGPRQQQCLLALLLVRSGRPVSMSDLINLIWGSDPPACAANIIQKYVGALRRLLEPDLPPRSSGSYLTRHSTGYRFTAGPETLDLVAFRQRVSAAKMSTAGGRPDEALDHYVNALRLCQGPAGDALAESTVATSTFAGVDGEFVAAAVNAAAVAVQVDRPAEVLAALRLATEIDRLNEPVHASLVTTLAAAGYQDKALVAHRTIRDRLAEELGIDPGRELREAQRRVLTQSAVPPTDERDQTEAPLLAGRSRPVPMVHPAQLPPDQPLFVGRRAELDTLDDLVGEMRAGGCTSPMVVAVDGMGGVGKSTLVVRFAHTVADEFTDGQLYLDLQGHRGEEGSVLAGDALRSLLYALGVHGTDIPDTFDALVGMYRSLTAGMRILVVLDNVRDSAQVRPLLPNSAASLVLITSRQPLVGLAASDSARLLGAYPPDLPDARELLGARLAAMRSRTLAVGDDAGTIDEIIELCGRLPLALAILAARLSARPHLSLGAVAAELRDGARLLAAFEGRGEVSDPRTAFSWSYRQLTPSAARLFRLLSVAFTAGITVEACLSLAGLRLSQARALLEELTEAALVTEDDRGHFTSHVLVKAYAQELFLTLESPDEQCAASSRLLQHYLHSSSNAELMLEPHRTPIVPPPPLPGVVPERQASHAEALSWFALHRETLKDAVKVAAEVDYGIVPWHLAVTTQQYLEEFGFFRDWEDVMRHALRATRERSDVIGEAQVLRSLARARLFSGANEEALGLLRAALDIFAEQGMLPEQAMAYVDLHRVHSALGRHDLALADSEKAVALNRAAGDTYARVRSLDCNGQSLTWLGQHEQAARVLQRALDLNAQIEYRHEDACIRVAMARNLTNMGRAPDAVQQLKLAARTAGEMGHGPNRFEVFRGLSELLLTVGDARGAQDAYGQAHEVLRSFQDGGPDHMRADLRRLAQRLARSAPRPSSADVT